ncbi:hypothetical protein [Klebsiella michiganensis]|uniref:hypothetical protein n=1 Tax=Klebsiella michiganensis TaxID=1134687 RepID=UPI0029496D94|nr:hypothetical protein [Klebsiella michiganensis]MDV5293872.1 hypothetical protein [Klebsiella michiganensis]MDV5346137.1 hypothetical protein [Klebsiella michiganensis]MDV5446596.1 hypothetical protein [Klebsiella michiganensis]
MKKIFNFTSNTDLTLVDEDGKVLISSQNLDYFPDDIVAEIIQPSELIRIADLTSNIFKGYASTSNRTVELLFKPEIKKGLESGVFSMMKTTSGETFADVTDNTTRKIVGKGRIVEGGRLKQLATGSFQLLSIIVAQSHLEEINKSINDLKSSINDLKNTIENNERGKILGSIRYLKGVVENLKDGKFEDTIPQQIKNNIEVLILKANEWQETIHLEIKELHYKIEKQKDNDRFGTGNTYQTLRTYIESIKPIIMRRNMVLRVSCLLNYLSACIDPTSKEFSTFEIETDEWNNCFNSLIKTTNQKIESLLKTAKFNSNEILELRRDKLKEITNSYITISKYDQANYDINRLRLQNHLKKMITGSGKFRLVVSFDENNKIRKAAIID